MFIKIYCNKKIMLKFKNISELQEKIRSEEITTSDLDYMEVDWIEYKMTSYDEAWKEIIWEEDKDSEKNKNNKPKEHENNVYVISMNTEDRYNKGVKDAKFEEYMY